MATDSKTGKLTLRGGFTMHRANVCQCACDSGDKVFHASSLLIILVVRARACMCVQSTFGKVQKTLK